MARAERALYAPLAAGLLLTTLVLGACAKPPPPLGEEEFEHLVDGEECERSCGGALTKSGWFKALGWQLDLGATLDSDNASLTVEGRGGAVVTASMPATTWTGGATFEVDLATSGASTGAEVRVGTRSRASDDSATLVLDPVTQSVRAEIVVGETTTMTSPLAYAIAGAHIELEVDCARATLSVDDQDATVRLDAAPSLDVFEIVVTGQVKVTVSEATLQTGCEPGESVACDPCDDVGACLTADCSALGACVQTPEAEATLCSDGNTCTQDDACDGQGACVPGESLLGCVPNLEGYEDAVTLSVFEPAHAPGAAVPTSLQDAHIGSDRSSFERANEPVALALKSGVRDESVRVYLPCDGSLTDEIGTLQFSEGGTFVAGKYADSVDGDEFETSAPIAAALSSARTMMAWLHRSPGPGPPAGNEPLNILGLTEPETGKPAFRFGFGDEGYHLRAGSQLLLIQGDVEKTGFHHVAATWDPDSNTGVVYFDGVATGRFSDLEPTTAAAFQLGAPNIGGADIDEVVYLDRAMSGAEIAAIVLTQRRFGDPLLAVDLQPDYDDLRVTTYNDGVHTVVDHEVMGRRVLSDTGKDAATVAAYYRFDGDHAPTLGGSPTAASEPSGVSVGGAFGDPDGAMRYPTQGPTLWSDRTFAFDGAFSVELWFKTLADLGEPCAEDLSAGAFLLQTWRSAAGGDSLADGWQLRLCGGAVRFDQGGASGATASLTGGPRVDDERWHHALVTRTTEGAVALFVDGLPADAAMSAASLFDSLSPVTALFAPGAGTAATPAALDELVFHSSAKSAAYAYQRVYPRLPTLRFNVSTAPAGASDYPIPRHTVHAGNPAAQALDSNCAGALMTCDATEAWWRFNEMTADGVTADSGPRGIHAQVQPAGRLVVGAAGLALSMEGLQSAIAALTQSVGAGSGLDEWTVEALVRTPTGMAQTLLAWGTSGGPGPYFEFAVDAQGKVVSSTTDLSGGSPSSIASSGAIGDFKWTTVGGSFSGTALAAFAQGSADGTLSVTSAPVAGPLPSSGQVTFGDGTDLLQGQLDEVRITGRALSAAERLKYPRLSVTASSLPPGPAP